MTTHPAIPAGRALVRLIEAADLLLTGELKPDERTAIEQARAIAKAKLRTLVLELPVHITAEILAASDNIHLTGEIGLN